VETASNHDWPVGRFSLKCCEAYISHTKPDHSYPNGKMLEGGEKHNISKNQTNSMVQHRDMAIWMSALEVLSLSPFFSFHSALLVNFCTILLFI
jgi:hypothetical protein